MESYWVSDSTALCDLMNIIIISDHTFELELDQEKWEYKYSSSMPSQCLSPDSDLRKTFWFPDYMMPHFLRKILTETYRNTDIHI